MKYDSNYYLEVLELLDEIEDKELRNQLEEAIENFVDDEKRDSFMNG